MTKFGWMIEKSGTGIEQSGTGNAEDTSDSRHWVDEIVNSSTSMKSTEETKKYLYWSVQSFQSVL